jgi:hypothetical protein
MFGSNKKNKIKKIKSVITITRKLLEKAIQADEE